MDIMTASEFEPRTIDKVERLLDLLEEMERHPALHGKLALHGGTAINLFMLNIPRLSVDIDVSYIGKIAREDMLEERPAIEAGIEAVARAQGYMLDPNDGGHAGRTFLLRYHGDWGTDHVKIDCIYMNRSPILKPTIRETPIRPGTRVRTFNDAELAGGKVKAFFDRVKVRDLYDIANLKVICDTLEPKQRKEAHLVLLYYASLSACFPNPFEERPMRFSNRQNELEDQLYPMLRLSAPKPSLESLITEAERFVAEWVQPQNDREQEYLTSFAAGSYDPALLFEDEAMIKAAEVNPEALWKLHNLLKMRSS